MDNRDPLVDEIHAAREALAKASDYDLQKLAEAARARQKSVERPVASFGPKPATTVKKAS